MKYSSDYFTVLFLKRRSRRTARGGSFRRLASFVLAIFLAGWQLPTYGGKPGQQQTSVVKFATTPGTSYQLQGTDDLLSGNWVALGDAFVAENKRTVISVSEYTAYTDFRLLILPTKSTSEPTPPPTAPPTLPNSIL